MDVAQWWEYANSVFPMDRKTRNFAVSEDNYNAVREKYYYDVLAPQIAAQGYSPEASKETFLKATERPGKAQYPKTELLLKSALHGALAPLAGVTGTSKELEAVVEEARKEATRSGVGSLTQGALQLGGEVAGMAPYFAAAGPAISAARGAGEAIAATKAGLKLAPAVTEALTGPAGRALFEAPVIGAVQGLYDATKAEDGHRLSEGLGGFAMGAGFTAMGEAGAELWRALKANNNLPTQVANAVANTTKGTATPAEEAIANTAINQQPEIGFTIEKWVGDSIRKAKALGNPATPPEVTPQGKLWMQMKGADGKPYNLTGLGGKDLDAVMERINTHLENGAEILRIGGAQENTNMFYSQLEKFHDIELPIQYRGKEVMVPDVPAPTAEAQGATAGAGKFAGMPGEVPQVPLTETPFVQRGVAPNAPFQGVTQGMGVGEKPTIIYGSETPSRETIFHEMFHAHLENLGIATPVTRALGEVPNVPKLAAALSPEAVRVAGASTNEEVASYLTSAVRTNDVKWLERFVKADDDLPTVLETASNIAKTVSDHALQMPDSLHKRVLLRKMNDVQRRAGHLSSLEDITRFMGRDLIVKDGAFTISDGVTSQKFTSRQDLTDFIERRWPEPINVPNLLDESHMPASAPKFAMAPPVDPPLATLPAIPPSERARFGTLPFSFFYRPFFPWLQSVATKAKNPELYSTFKGIEDAVIRDMHYVQPLENKLFNVLKDIKPDKRKGLYQYLEAAPADQAALATNLNMSPKDVKVAERLLKEVIEPLGADVGFSGPELFEYLRLARGGTKVKPTSTLSQDKIDVLKEATSGFDLRTNDALHITHSLIREGGRLRNLEPQLEAAEKLINVKDDEGAYVLGSIRPLLKRHVEHMRSRPDYSQQVINSLVGATFDALNEGITKLNKGLPSGVQLPHVTSGAREAMGRYMLFNYAATMGMRPMSWVRDGMQVFTVTLPILGPKYFDVGMRKAFGAVPKGTQSEAYQIARKYGALIEHSDLHNLYTMGGENPVSGKMTDLANTMLKPMQFSNNSNRLVSFWGHSEKAYDAMLRYRDQPEQFVKASGLMYADKGYQDAVLKQMSPSMSPVEMRDLSYKIGKEMTDLSQWNYHKGAQPGMYKYAIGRLFGQYGTWPMNYLEYGRRVLTTGDAKDKALAAGLWALPQYVILKGGDAVGVDTGSWVFTGPLAYGGGPILNATLSAPMALDVQGPRGAEARRQLMRIPSMSVPGGLAMEQIYHAIVREDPDLWKVVFGFNPETAADTEKGIHSLL